MLSLMAYGCILNYYYFFQFWGWGYDCNVCYRWSNYWSIKRIWIHFYKVRCNMYKEYNIAKDLVYDTCYWGDYCSIRCYYCNNKYKH